MLDVNIYYCVSDGMYGHLTLCLGAREAMRPFLLCFGVWHGCQYALHCLYTAYLSLLVSISHNTFLNNLAIFQVYGFPNL